MNITRTETPTGSHIEPPFDDDWDTLTKLHWKAAVVTEDTGHAISLKVEESNYSTRIAGVWVRNRGYYNITISGSSSSGPFDFHEAWDYLNGISAGVQAIRQAASDG